MLEELELGAKYKNRNGEVFEIVKEQTDNLTFPFIGKRCVPVPNRVPLIPFTRTGKFYPPFLEIKSNYDLVEKVNEES